MLETCIVEILGQISYAQAWEYQKRLTEEIARGERAPTLVLEHPHTTYWQGIIVCG